MGLTAAYVLLTLSLVRQNRALWEETVKPIISVRPVIDPNLFHILKLRIENVGGGSAQSIQLRITNPPLADPVKHLAENGVFRKGVALMNARERLEFFLMNAIGDFDKVRDHPIQITASYKDLFGKRYEGYFVVDIGEFENLTRVGEPPLMKLADSVGELKDHLRSIAGGTKLNVIVSTLEDEEREGRVTKLWVMLRRLDRIDPSAREEIEKLIESKVSKN